MDLYIEEYHLGELFFAPMDVKFDENNVYQPDILFITATRKKELLTESGIVEGAPDLVVEVLSPANTRQEQEKKLQQYEKYGVIEYWVIHPKESEILIYILEDDKYKIHAEGKQNTMVESSILKGFQIAYQDLVGI